MDPLVIVEALVAHAPALPPATAEQATSEPAEPERPATSDDRITLTDPAASEAPVTASSEGTEEMATIAENVADTAGATINQAQAMFGDMGERTRNAVEKGSKMLEDLTDFSKGNVEAVVASGRVATKGAETLFQSAAEYNRKNLEKVTSAFQSLASIKSPTELLQLQQQFAKSSFDSVVADASKASEAYIKYVGDVMEPLSSRLAIAADKFKAPAL